MKDFALDFNKLEFPMGWVVLANEYFESLQCIITDSYYLSVRKGVFLHLNKFQFLLPLKPFHVWFKLAMKHYQCILTIFQSYMVEISPIRSKTQDHQSIIILFCIFFFIIHMLFWTFFKYIHWKEKEREKER